MTMDMTSLDLTNLYHQAIVEEFAVDGLESLEAAGWGTWLGRAAGVAVGAGLIYGGFALVAAAT